MKFVAAVVVLALAGWLATSSSALAGQLERGREIYLTGKGVHAKVAGGATSITGNAVACKGCHGAGAAGGREGPTVFPAIDWQTLSSPSSQRPAYEATGFIAAIRHGKSTTGAALSNLMPKYEIDDYDAQALRVYLAAVRAEQVSGVDAGDIHFAVVTSDRFSAVGEVLKDSLNARFQAMNERFHGRSVSFELVVGPSQLDRLSGATAVVGSVSEDPGLYRAIAERNVPNLFPFSPFQGDEDSDLALGTEATTRQMVVALVEQIAAAGKPTLLCPGSTEYDKSLAAMAVREAKRNELDLASLDAESCFAQSDKDVLLFWSAPGQPDLTASKRTRRVYALLDQIAPMRDAFHAAGYSLALANSRIDLMQKALRDGTPLVNAHAEVVAALLKEALVRAGRDVTRSQLTDALDDFALNQKDMPQLDFRRGRLNGGAKAEILSVGP